MDINCLISLFFVLWMLTDRNDLAGDSRFFKLFITIISN